MITVNVDPSVFNTVYYPHLRNTTRTQIFFGGSSSGKSVFIAQRVIDDLLRGGRNYLVVRNVGVTLRTSSFNELRKVITNWGVSNLFYICRTSMTISCVNGYQIIFRGLDDVEKMKSITPEKGIITDVWVEEATETKRDDIKQLQKRLRGISVHPKRLTLSFNPIIKTHWLYKDHFAGRFHDGDTMYQDDELFILKTCHQDNKFLAPEDRAALESEQDEYFYQVYTLGNWGVLGDLVFTNWRTEDLSSTLDAMGHYYDGLDFGFTNDPSAHVRCAIRDKTIFVTHGFYEYKLTNPEIAERLRPVVGSDLVRCDAAEPKSIHELRQHRINATAAGKGPGSLNHGIQYLKQFDIVVHRQLQGLINELGLYQWHKNRDGNVTNQPVDKYNHAIDALRYALSVNYIKQEQVRHLRPRDVGVYVP